MRASLLRRTARLARLAPLALPALLVLTGAMLLSCTDDSGSPDPVAGGIPGGACACDSDCRQFGNWSGFCFKGICMLEPLADCSAEGACPADTSCVELTHQEVAIPACALHCDLPDPDKQCLGACDQQGLCMPGEGDNCLEGCCTAADPPIASPDTPDYPESEWEEPTCGPETYPCPPYGTGRNRTMANERFLPANQAAVQLAGEDGVLSMKDLYQADAKAIMIFVSASWCPYCGTEANQLDDLYQSYKDDERGKVLFLGVLSQDSGGNPATVSEAEMYASSRGWTFPAVPDVNYVTEQYFLTPAYPFHIFIDGRTMTIEKSLHAALTTSDLSSHIEDLLNN